MNASSMALRSPRRRPGRYARVVAAPEIRPGGLKRIARSPVGRGMTELTAQQERLCDESRWDFSDLRALYVNCTLKRSPEVSHTQGLADLSIAIMERNGVAVETIRAVDHEIATGVYPDMTEHGWERDDWPAISEKVHGRRHPRDHLADLAGGEVVGLHAGHRAPVRQQPHPQRGRPVRLLRARRAAA